MVATFNFRPSDRNQTSYASKERADEYFLERPNSPNWNGTGIDDDDKERALMKATKEINSLRLVGSKHINYNNDQRLHFPIAGSAVQTGTVDSATSATIVDDTLADEVTRPDNFWKYGSIKITSGTGDDQTREIASFDSSAGEITVTAVWTTTPDSTSKYELVAAIFEDIFFALCEMAYWKMPDATTGNFEDLGDDVPANVKRTQLGRFEEEYFENINGIRIPVTAVNYLKKYLSLSW